MPRRSRGLLARLDRDDRERQRIERFNEAWAAATPEERSEYIERVRNPPKDKITLAMEAMGRCCERAWNSISIRRRPNEVAAVPGASSNMDGVIPAPPTDDRELRANGQMTARFSSPAVRNQYEGYLHEARQNLGVPGPSGEGYVARLHAEGSPSSSRSPGVG